MQSGLWRWSMMTRGGEEVTTVKGGEETTTIEGVTKKDGEKREKVEKGRKRDKSERRNDSKFQSSRGVQLDVREDGTVGVALEYRRQFNVAEKVGKIGGWLVVVGVLLTLIAPALFLLGFLPASFMFGLIATPFTIGAAFIALATYPNFLPGA